MYTDGGCHNTGDRKGDGSYAFLIVDDDTIDNGYVDVFCGFVQDTTNNRMEMLAVIKGIEYVDNNTADMRPNIDIVSDSGYLVKGFTNPAYLDRWLSNGWKTSNNKPVQNRDMWMKLNKMSWFIGINFIHIRGHKKDRNKTHAFWNDICDKACTYVMNELPTAGFLFTLRYDLRLKTFEVVGYSVQEV